MGKKVKKPVKKRQFSVYLDDSLCVAIEHRAEREERSSNYIIERCLKRAKETDFFVE